MKYYYLLIAEHMVTYYGKTTRHHVNLAYPLVRTYTHYIPIHLSDECNWFYIDNPKNSQLFLPFHSPL